MMNRHDSKKLPRLLPMLIALVCLFYALGGTASAAETVIAVGGEWAEGDADAMRHVAEKLDTMKAAIMAFYRGKFGDKTEEVSVPADETLDDKAEAPQTFDFGVIAAVAAVISLGGFAVSKKRH